MNRQIAAVVVAGVEQRRLLAAVDEVQAWLGCLCGAEAPGHGCPLDWR